MKEDQVIAPPVPKMRPASNQGFATYTSEHLLDNLCYSIVRPERHYYNETLLTPKGSRSKFTLSNYNIPFSLSLWTPPDPLRYTLLYLHGSSACRIEAMSMLDSLPRGVALASFDFNGCGNRGDFYLTLGLREATEVDTAAQFLINQGHRVVGWGRSMGSVSLLRSTLCSVFVLDSPFSDIKRLCQEKASSQVLPKCPCLVNCLFPCLYCCLKRRVQTLARFNMDELNNATFIEGLNRALPRKPIAFLHGAEDTLINPSHSALLQHIYQGPKLHLTFQGTHNSTRPPHVMEKVFSFIEQQLSLVKPLLQQVTRPRIVSESQTHLN